MKLFRTGMTLGLLMVWGLLKAQQPPTPSVHHITARQAVDLALKQRTEMLNGMLDIKNQQAVNKELTGAAYPQIAGSIGGQYNFEIPVTVLPDFISPTVYGVLEDQGVKDGNGNPIKWDGVVNTFPAQFGLPWQVSLGVSVKQLLFQPDVFIGLKARDAAERIYHDQLKITDQTVKKSVLEAYFGVLIAQRGLGFAKESQARLTQLYKEQEALFKNGFIEKLDLEKTSVSLYNIKSNVLRLSNTVSQTYAGLKMAMGFGQADSLVLMDSLTLELLQQDVMALDDDFKYENRPEVQTLQTRDELLNLQLRRYKLQALPTIAGFWNMQTNAQRKRFNIFDTNDRWFFSNVAGISLSVPITDGWQRHNRTKQATYALEKNRNTLRQLEQSIDFELVSARTQLTNALEALNNQVENKTLAEKVFATTKTKYEQGLGSSFEVLQSEFSLQEALSNYYQAMYGVVVARIAFMKAVGKL